MLSLEEILKELEDKTKLSHQELQEKIITILEKLGM